MIAIEYSCDPEKLRKVLIISKAVMKGFYGLSKEDKEDILIEVIAQFEKDGARFPASVYGRYCRNKVLGFLAMRTAKKRMAQSVVGGKVVYWHDISLSMAVGDEEDMEFANLLPQEDYGIAEVEVLAMIEKKAPDMLEAVKGVLRGEKLTRQERARLKKVISREDLLHR